MKPKFRSILVALLLVAISTGAFGESFETSRETQPDFVFRVALGLEEGWSPVRKFADRSAINTADGNSDIWNYIVEKTYTYSTSADIDTLSSSDAADTQVVKVFGLDANFDEVVQDVTLTGQTKAMLTTPLIRVWRMLNMGTTDFAGEIYLYVDGAITLGVPNVTTTVRAYINDGDNQTLMSMYTVPRGKTAAVTDFTAALSRGTAATTAIIEARVRPFGGVFTTKLRFTITTTGTSQFVSATRLPLAFPEKTDFLVRADVTANDTGVAVVFNLVLVDMHRLVAP